MTTTTYVVDTEAYTLVSETDCVIQNLSAYPVRVVFSDSAPDKDTPHYGILYPQGRNKNRGDNTLTKMHNVPEGSVYLRCEGSSESGRTSKVAVETSESTDQGLVSAIGNLQQELEAINEAIAEGIDVSVVIEELNITLELF